MKKSWRRPIKIGLGGAALALLFVLYSWGITENPPGFYLDESGLTYNAYVLAHTGAGEFGPPLPLFFQCFSDGYVQTINPAQIYMLAAIFLVLPPSILLSRLYSAFFIFAACILLGFLAKRTSGWRTIGVIVGTSALLTPWFFDMRGLLIEAQFLPFPLALFLFVLFGVHKKEHWAAIDLAKLVGSLALMSYSTIAGRFLAPFLVLGLLLFATTKQRLVNVVKVGICYGASLLPIVVFNWSHPGLLAKRFHETSYIRQGVPWNQIASQFFDRYLEDQGLTGLLLNGDPLARHHIPGSGGPFFFATFILAVIGLLVVVTRRRNETWWRFILYGLVISIVPSAIGIYAFHATRLLAYPVFLLVLTVPALEWLLARSGASAGHAPKAATGQDSQENKGQGLNLAIPRVIRFCFLLSLLALTGVEAYKFQTFFRREGPKRSYEFDVTYKAVYDAAIGQPSRPIYLEDGRWGPAYIHALWYAALEKRPRSEFVHLKPGVSAPPGAVVISSGDCQSCETLLRSSIYQVYKSR
jgi:disulfide bond formation protein DsbB